MNIRTECPRMEMHLGIGLTKIGSTYITTNSINTITKQNKITNISQSEKRKRDRVIWVLPVHFTHMVAVLKFSKILLDRYLYSVKI